jgi:hypothetical protein
VAAFYNDVEAKPSAHGEYVKELLYRKGIISSTRGITRGIFIEGARGEVDDAGFIT